MRIHKTQDPCKSFLTPSQLSKILGTCGNTIRKAIERGEIPAKKIGRFYYVPASFLENVQCLEKGKANYVSPQ